MWFHSIPGFGNWSYHLVFHELLQLLRSSTYSTGRAIRGRLAQAGARDSLFHGRSDWRCTSPAARKRQRRGGEKDGVIVTGLLACQIGVAVVGAVKRVPPSNNEKSSRQLQYLPCHLISPLALQLGSHSELSSPRRRRAISPVQPKQPSLHLGTK